MERRRSIALFCPHIMFYSDRIDNQTIVDPVVPHGFLAARLGAKARRIQASHLALYK